MYPLSPSADLAFFDGAQLLQVCFGRNEVILHFDGAVTLTILSDFELGDGNSVTRTNSESEKASGLLTLLHESVRDASATQDGGLLLRFSSNKTLEALDTSTSYESFWIKHGDDVIIV